MSESPVALVTNPKTSSTAAIDLLTTALQLAQQGKIAAIGMVIVKKSGSTITEFCAEPNVKFNTDTAVGAADRLKSRIADEW